MRPVRQLQQSAREPLNRLSRLLRPLLAAGWLALSAWPAAQAATVPGEIMVQLRSGDAIGGVLQRHGLTMVSRFGARPIFRLKTIGGASVNVAISALLTDPNVLLAEPNGVNAPPEADKNNVWVVGSSVQSFVQWAPRALRLPTAHAMSRGAGVRVAVLDTGVDRSHPALVGRLDPGYDFVDGDTDPSEVGSRADAAHGHGTHVAGIVAMVAPLARVMPLRVLDASGQGNAWVLAEAMLHAVDPDRNPATADGAQVINLSLGGLERTQLMQVLGALVSCSGADPTNPLLDLADPGYNDDKARCAQQAGAVVVAAAGNNGSFTERWYPAAENAYGLMAVAASTSTSTVASFSNFGRWVHLAAPGEGITSTVPGGGWGTWSGTSMAAPMVAGSAALLRSLAPTIKADEIKRCLLENTAPLRDARLRRVDPAAAMDRYLRSGRCR